MTEKSHPQLYSLPHTVMLTTNKNTDPSLAASQGNPKTKETDNCKVFKHKKEGPRQDY